jgi:ubiquinone/menaquinone biosynthesis C-methylase UbiE
MVAQARRRLTKEIAAGRVALRQGSVSSLPFADDTFHRLLAINTLLFWPHPVRDLGESKRVLVPGGNLLIVMQPRRVRDAARVQRVADHIASQVAAAGFTEITPRIHPTRSAPYVAVHAKKP